MLVCIILFRICSMDSVMLLMPYLCCFTHFCFISVRLDILRLNTRGLVATPLHHVPKLLMALLVSHVLTTDKHELYDGGLHSGEKAEVGPLACHRQATRETLTKGIDIGGQRVQGYATSIREA